MQAKRWWSDRLARRLPEDRLVFTGGMRAPTCNPWLSSISRLLQNDQWIRHHNKALFTPYCFTTFSFLTLRHCPQRSRPRFACSPGFSCRDRCGMVHVCMRPQERFFFRVRDNSGCLLSYLDRDSTQFHSSLHYSTHICVVFMTEFLKTLDSFRE